MTDNNRLAEIKQVVSNPLKKIPYPPNVIDAEGHGGRIIKHILTPIEQVITRNELDYIMQHNALEKFNLASVNFSKVDLSGLNFSDTIMHCSNFFGANLTGAIMVRADLTECNFKSANLSGANLCGADLKLADLQGADLSNATLFSADLSTAYLYGAVYNNQTVFSLGFDPESQGMVYKGELKQESELDFLTEKEFSDITLEETFTLTCHKTGKVKHFYGLDVVEQARLSSKHLFQSNKQLKEKISCLEKQIEKIKLILNP